MHRWLSICKAGACLAALSACFVDRAIAQEPAGVAPLSTAVSSPRTDLYTTYSDAYCNPESVAPYGGETAGMGEGIWKPRRAFRFYAGGDVVRYHRTLPANKVLVTVTNNLFDTGPDGTFGGTTFDVGQLNADPAGRPLFRTIIDVENRPLNENIDTRPVPLEQRYINPSLRAPNDPVYRRNVQRELLPGSVLMETDDFDYNMQYGFRPKIGVILPSGNRIEFNYMWTKNYTSNTLIQDVSGSAFLTQQISATSGVYVLQRFGYLSSPFRTRDYRFYGESRRSFDAVEADVAGPGSDLVNVQGDLRPHYPGFEQPPLELGFAPPGTSPPLFAGAPGGGFAADATDGYRSSDIPREPTNDDPTVLGTTDPNANVDPNSDRFNFSLLWQDGEIAVANYSFDLRAAELVYKRDVFNFERNNLVLTLTGGMRFVHLNESLSFYFADIAGTGPIPGTGGLTPRNPFDRQLANQGWDDLVRRDPDRLGGDLAARPQPAAEAQATYANRIANHIWGPQIGFETTIPFLEYFEFNSMAKGGFMVNNMQNQVRVFRQDGLFLYDYSKESDLTSGVIEGSIGMTFRPHRNISIRGGWEFMYLNGVGTSVSNIDFDLDQQRRPNNSDNVLFNGWYGGVEVVF